MTVETTSTPAFTTPLPASFSALVNHCPVLPSATSGVLPPVLSSRTACRSSFSCCWSKPSLPTAAINPSMSSLSFVIVWTPWLPMMIVFHRCAVSRAERLSVHSQRGSGGTSRSRTRCRHDQRERVLRIPSRECEATRKMIPAAGLGANVNSVASPDIRRLPGQQRLAGVGEQASGS